MTALAAHAVDLYPMAAVLETMLICQDRQHALEALVGKLDHPAAALADEVLVICLRGHRLVTPESLAEFMGPHQTAFYQEVKGPVHGSSSHPLAPMLELSKNGIDREVVLGTKYDLSYQVALAGHRLVVLPKVTTKSFEKRGGKVVGAIGVSGGSGDQDHAVAEAGAAAFGG